MTGERTGPDCPDLADTCGAPAGTPCEPWCASQAADPSHTGMALPAPGPIEREPHSVWPPFTGHDYRRFEHLSLTDPHAWRQAVHLDRVAAIMSALAGITLSEREHAIVAWLAGWDVPTVAPIVRLLLAARAAAPLAGDSDDAERRR